MGWAQFSRWGSALGALVVIALAGGRVQAQQQLDVGEIYFGSAACRWSSGTASPESNVTGSVCDMYWETDAGEVYTKKTGTASTTGWVNVGGLPAYGAAGTFLRSTGSAWASSTLVLPNAISAGQLVYGSSSNTLSALTAGASGTLLAGGTTPAFTATPSVTSLTASGSVTGTTSVITPLIAPTGDLTITPAGNDILPGTGYVVNVGAFNRKFLTLHAAELWVQTLVAQSVMATIGGRVMVGPTTTLTSDLTAIATSIVVKHNQLASGHRVLLEGGGFVEWIAITSGPSGAGPYTYSVTRNLDGSGANAWTAGDAVFNTGTIGNGYIDIYSLAGAIPGSTAGPTMVGMVRFGTTYSDVTPMWALGNLNGHYGYATDTYGAAFGNDSISWLKIDTTDGIRMGFGTTTNFSVDTSGNAFFGGEIEAREGDIGRWTIEEGAITAAGAGLYSDHVVDTALDLNGSSYYASKAFATGVVNDFTLGVWAYASSSSGTPVVMYIGKADNGYGIRIVGGNWGGYYVGAANIGNVSAVALNTWTHLALRRSGGSSQFFVNGVATGSAIGTAPLGAPNGHWSVGALRNIANSGFQDWFTGRAAHSFFTQSALTNTQIATIATGGPGGIGLAPHLVATGNYPGQSPLFQYYPLFGGTASYDMWDFVPTAPMAVVGGVVAGPSVAMERARVEVGSGAFTAGLVSAPTSGDVFLYGGTYFGNRAAAPFRVTNLGALHASSGTVGNWSMSVVGLYYDGAGASTSAGMVPTDWPFYAGSLAVNRATAPFRVSPAGALFATNATISGAVTATSGSFTGAIVATSISLPTGSVTSAHIAANTIVAGDIFGSTITSAEIVGTTLSAIEANLGTITAGAITGTSFATNFVAINDTDGVFFEAASGASDFARAVSWDDGSVILSRTDVDSLHMRGPSDGTWSQMNLYYDFLEFWGGTSGSNSMYLDASGLSTAFNLNLGANGDEWGILWLNGASPIRINNANFQGSTQALCVNSSGVVYASGGATC